MSLTNRCVIVTRPAHQAGPLCDALQAAGATVLRLPLIEIRKCSPVIKPESTDVAWVVFTSPNAVYHGHALLAALNAPPRLAAVGAATAQALHQAGHPEVLYPAQDYSSEGLLALPAMQSVHGQKVLLMKGEGGRRVLAEGLRERGAIVTPVIVYQRSLLTPGARAMRRSLEAANAAIVTSNEILQRLYTLTPQDLREQLAGLQLVVPSARVVQMAQSLGFRDVLQVPSPLSDSALVQALRRTGPDARQAGQTGPEL